MPNKHRYVVAYDVSEDDIRRRIRRACRAYGGHQQYSLFEMYLTAHQFETLVAQLEEIVSSASEPAAIKLYSVGPENRDTSIGDVEDRDFSNVV